MLKKILCCFLFLHLISSIFIFTIIILNINDPYKNNHNLQETVKAIFNNQIQPPLKEIRITRGISRCTQDEKSLMIYNWKGIKTGCVCEDGEFRQRPKRSVNENCEFIQDKPGVVCNFIKSKSEENFKIWEGNRFCATAYSSNDYTFLKKGEKCPKNQKTCNNNLCVRSDLVCPITSLTEGVSTDPEKIQLNDAYLKINRNINENPLIDLKASIKDAPCLNPNTSPKVKRYPSYNEPTNGCDEYETVSAWSSFIREEKQDLFFKENMVELFSLNFFLKFMDLNEKVKLFSISRISSNNENACSIYNNEVIEKLDESASSLDKAFWISVWALIFCSISSILLIYYFINHEKDLIVIVSLFILSFGLVICGFCFGGIYLSEKSRKFNNGSSIGEAFTDITHSKCYQNYPGITHALNDIIRKEESSGSEQLKICAYVVIIWHTMVLISITGILVINGPFRTLEALLNAE